MLCIVSVYRPDVLEEAMYALTTMGVLAEVILDRRHGERRHPVRANSESSRANERRQRNIDEELRTEGVAIIR